MKTCVMFLLTGPSHLPNLVVALESLRNHWGGKIFVFAWPQSYDIALEICADPHFGADVRLCGAEYQGKNAQELSKMSLIHNRVELQDYDMVVYLDADIFVAGSLQPLIDAATPTGFAATQFCDWRMSQGIPRRRAERMVGRDIPQQHVQAALDPNAPAYNSGIFASRPGNPLLETWYNWTWSVKDIFIAGETTLHAIAQAHPIATLYGGAFNCSTKYQPIDLRDEDVVIWHFHGDSNIRPKKSLRGYEMWWPKFLSVLDQNLGGIQGWIDSIDNPYLQNLRTGVWDD